MRTFATGATRDSDDGKFDFEGFLSPLSLKRFGQYMHKHRKQSDGGMRDSDNWQNGLPLDAYMKSAWRHFFDVWAMHRGHPTLAGEDMEEELCAVLFNIQGYLHEHLKAKQEYALEPVRADVTFTINPDDPFYHIWLELEQSREHGA